MKKLLALTAVVEALTGLILIACPADCRQVVIQRGHCRYRSRDKSLRRLGLLALGVACCPCGSASRALYGMLTYSSLTTLGLLFLALSGKWHGSLPVAGSCVACSPDAASRANLVQATRERISLRNPVAVLSPSCIPFRTRHACHHSCSGSRACHAVATAKAGRLRGSTGIALKSHRQIKGRTTNCVYSDA
jgi:uncharacterized protein YjeT (DUF2065 family)